MPSLFSRQALEQFNNLSFKTYPKVSLSLFEISTILVRLVRLVRDVYVTCIYWTTVAAATTRLFVIKRWDE